MEWRYPHAYIVNNAYCECQFVCIRYSYIVGNSKSYLPHHYHIHCRNGYINNGINIIKTISTLFLLATFVMISIIPSYQLFKLYIFIFFIDNNISLIKNDISCSHKYICKSLGMTWPIGNEKLINSGGMSLILLLPCVFLSFSLTTTSVSSTTILVLVINAALSYSKSFKMTCLMNNGKQMSLGILSLLMPLLSPESVLNR